ncbi:uncharacterized protein LOC130800871 [Amaranthus tricolor]|uniref:uncharacterized protein LOC130800871 n=1 Tax=Amaranthus tricolor TaxID=29722 RepID=UPI00258F366F|nr:uncharacterized protein LOC130800871 [Amaranthus tricolor]
MNNNKPPFHHHHNNHHPHPPPPHNRPNYPQPPPHNRPNYPQPPPHNRPNYSQPPPYNRRQPPKPPKSTLSSCIVATIFLLFLIILIFILYFSLFKPKNPSISITAVTLPSFTLSTNSSTVSFTFSLYAAVKNPNRAVFTHFDSSLQLLYLGNQVGFMFIPAGKIEPGKTELMAATFSIQEFPISKGNVPTTAMSIGPPVSDGIERVKPAMEVEMKMEMVGRIRVLWFFSHHVETVSDCRVEITIYDGSVLGFHC